MVSCMVLGQAEHQTALRPVQAISHIIVWNSAFTTNDHKFSRFILGVVLNGIAMVGWSIVAEVAFILMHVAPGQLFASTVIGCCVSALAYYTDFHLVPKRFTPGFEHILSGRSLLTVYIFLAISIIIGGMMRVI